MSQAHESPSLTARIEALTEAHRERLAARQEALGQARRAAEDALRLEGAINELSRWQTEIWEGKEDASE